MRNLSYFIVLILIALSSCTNNKTNFILKGSLNEVSDKYLILSEMKTHNIITIDSIKSDEAGNFVLKGKTDSAKLYVLSMKGANDYINLVIHPNDEISIKIMNFSFPVKYTISGSEDSKLILYTHDKLFELLDQKVGLNKYYRDNINNADIENLRKKVKFKIDSLDSNYKKEMVSFIKKNASSLGCLPALYQQIGMKQFLFDPEKDFEIYHYVDSMLLNLFPNSSPVLSLHQQVEKVKHQSIRQGKQVPDISLASPDGKTISLSSLKGKIVLLDFWASWCPPCRKENPNLVNIYKKFHSKGFEIYQVSLDKSKEAWTTAIFSDGLEWIHVSDLGYWNSSVVSQYGIEGIPTNYLLDEKGIMIAKNLFGQALEDKLIEIYKK